MGHGFRDVGRGLLRVVALRVHDPDAARPGPRGVERDRLSVRRPGRIEGVLDKARLAPGGNLDGPHVPAVVLPEDISRLEASARLPRADEEDRASVRRPDRLDVVEVYPYVPYIQYLLPGSICMSIFMMVMIGGGIILLFVDRFFQHPTIAREEEITLKQSFIIGCYQTLSIIFPGLSRSAATIIGGMSQKLTRSLAAEFSFLLAVPTMFAASVKSFYDVYKEHPEVLNTSNMGTLGVGSLVSFVVALMAVKFLIGYLQNHGFKVFGYYRIVVGVTMIILLLLGVNLNIAG